MRNGRGRRGSGLLWLGAALTPWMAGLGLLVSFTATAGTENAIGSSRLAELDGRIVPALPPGMALIGAAIRLDGATKLLAIERADAVGARRLGE
ncbi:cell wall hydrolase, partial [Methylobacterium trifolii]